MTGTEFVYTTYIKTTPERLWQALTDLANLKTLLETGDTLPVPAMTAERG
jgi:uncharacterized protein YndB with AHSA1/START domain